MCVCVCVWGGGGVNARARERMPAGDSVSARVLCFSVCKFDFALSTPHIPQLPYRISLAVEQRFDRKAL